MKTYIQKAMNFIREEEGASAVEYALLVSLIAVAVVAAVSAFDIKGIFTKANQIVTTQQGGG
jgi:pilus assembly protein Flp/PilA